MEEEEVQGTTLSQEGSRKMKAAGQVNLMSRNKKLEPGELRLATREINHQLQLGETRKLMALVPRRTILKIN